MYPIIFLDIDGVLNCQVFYEMEALRTGNAIRRGGHDMCKERISWLNDLCNETGAKVVISSSWRIGRSVEELREIFESFGSTFSIIDKTGSSANRGTEIYQWLDKNTMTLFGVHNYDYYNYAIIDDDSDMLLLQQENFFHVDNYAGLTPNTCYKIKRFFKKYECPVASC